MLTIDSLKLNLLLQELNQTLRMFYGDRLTNVILFGSHAPRSHFSRRRNPPSQRTENRPQSKI
jgi:hypothetical protein